MHSACSWYRAASAVSVRARLTLCPQMYDGIHYDPLALSFGRDLPEDLDQTVRPSSLSRRRRLTRTQIFALTDTASLAKATAMCQALHQARPTPFPGVHCASPHA